MSDLDDKFLDLVEGVGSAVAGIPGFPVPRPFLVSCRCSLYERFPTFYHIHTHILIYTHARTKATHIDFPITPSSSSQVSQTQASLNLNHPNPNIDVDVGVGVGIGIGIGIDPDPPLPTSNDVQTLIRLRRMKMWTLRLEELLLGKLEGMRGACAEKEYMCRRIMLDNLVIAVESEANIVDIGRVSGFMQKAHGVSSFLLVLMDVMPRLGDEVEE
ncbi:hypothetical protein GYMLUDRAFT_64759 [Collybiopsis luxurians FD-317 M1]|uniref:Uncharacterized protein n=1 Tax=Collybiopsis luxurians FD-317 M1 TaxID=944289 RepID=A0A0D0AMT9_9AGAR|nr:hypothetical protein GYMLUDRAFT_64759 [Collybiopsis luxurians FD-317 M1]